MHLHRSIASAFISPCRRNRTLPLFCVGCFALLITTAKVWQGVEVARGAHPGHGDAQANGPGTKAVAVVTLPGKPAQSVRFDIK